MENEFTKASSAKYIADVSNLILCVYKFSGSQSVIVIVGAKKKRCMCQHSISSIRIGIFQCPSELNRM